MPSSKTTASTAPTAAASSSASASSSSSLQLSAQEKNARMVADRTFIRQLMQAALQGDGPLVQSLTTNYAVAQQQQQQQQQQHDHDNHNHNHDDDDEMISIPHILTSCRDGQRRNVLHFACQSTAILHQQNNNHDDNNNIVQFILSKLFPLPSPTTTTTSSDHASSSSIPNDAAAKHPNTTTTTTFENMTLHRRRLLLRAKDKDGLTPLMLAAQNPVYAESFCRSLLQDPQLHPSLALARSNVGATALHYAAGTHYHHSSSTTTTTTITTNNRHDVVLRLLCDHGKVALDTNSLQGGTPLHWAAAAAGGAISIVSDDHQTKQDKDQDEDEKEEENATTTTIVIFQTLLDLGANINARNEQGLTPLVVCMATGNDQASCYLIHASSTTTTTTTTTALCDISTVLPDGNTLLHMAVHLNLIQTLQALLRRIHHSTNDTLDLTHLLHAKNDQGQTPLDVACQEGHMECIRLLLTRPNKDGNGNEDDEVSASPTEVLECYREWTARNQQQEQEPQKEPTPKAPESSQLPPPSPPNDDGNKDDALSPQEAEWKQQALATMQTCSTPPLPANEQEALEWKQKGNQAYGAKDWTKALEYYSKAIELHPTEHTLYSNRSATYLALLAAVHDKQDVVSASAAAEVAPKSEASTEEPIPSSTSPEEQQQQQPTNSYATLALQDAIWTTALRPEWPKSWYRLSMARLQQGERFEDAAMAAWQGLQLDQSNSELQHLLRTCVERGRQYEQEQKAAVVAANKATADALKKKNETQAAGDAK